MPKLPVIFNVLKIAFMAHAVRPRHILLTMAGFAIGVAVLALLLSIPEGLDRLAARTGLDNVLIVMDTSAGSDEIDGAMSSSDAAIVATLPGIAKSADGRALVAPQYLVSTSLRRQDGSRLSVLVRGITDRTLRIVGNSVAFSTNAVFDGGTSELIAGDAAAHMFHALPGRSIKIRDAQWRISGTFKSNGNLWESELWADLNSLRQAFNARGQVSVLWVKCNSTDAMGIFTRALAADPRVNRLTALPQRTYYRARLGFISRYIRMAAAAIALVLGLGAVLAIGNALTMSFNARRRELAVLRALGFRNDDLWAALVFEAMLIAGLVAACVLAAMYLFLSGLQIGTSSGTQALGIRLSIDGEVALCAFVYAMTLGIIAALWPAYTVTHANLRESLQQA